jgi:hypothetical protein
MLKNEKLFYIDGKWVEPHSKHTLAVQNPANEEVIGTIVLGDLEDVNRAVAAAKKAFQTFSKTTVEERAALLERIIAAYQKKMPEIAAAVSKEMGAPISLATAAQAPAGLGHLFYTLNAMKSFEWERDVGRNRIVHEAIGVLPSHAVELAPQSIAAKVAPAMPQAAMILPTEIAPLSAVLFAEVMDEAGVRRASSISSRVIRCRRGIVVAPGRRHGVVYRFDTRRNLRSAERGTDRQARHPGTRRQIRQHPARRCGFSEGGRARHGLVRDEQRSIV